MKDLNETTNTAPDSAEAGMSEEFRKCLKQERDRERSRRESAQGKFEASHLSLDRFLNTFEDPSKAAVFSDGSTGEERIVAGCDGDGGIAHYRTCVKRAMNRLRGHPELQKTLRLIVKHGKPPRGLDVGDSGVGEMPHLGCRQDPLLDSPQKNVKYFLRPINTGVWTLSGEDGTPLEKLQNAKNPRLRLVGGVRFRRGSGATAPPDPNKPTERNETMNKVKTRNGARVMPAYVTNGAVRRWGEPSG